MDAKDQKNGIWYDTARELIPEAPDFPTTEVESNATGQLVPQQRVSPPQHQRPAWLRVLLSNPKSLFGAGIVLFFVAVSLLAPFVAPGDPSQFVGSPYLPPSAEYIFGTDSQGRDVFHLTVWGGRGTLIVGLGTGLLTMFVAVVIGMTAGYFRGRLDDVLTVLMNLFLVIPGLPLLILLTAYLKAGTLTVIGALSFTSWAYCARIIRAQTLSVREKEFVNSCIVSGESDIYIIFHELLPNITSVIASSFIGAVVYSIGAATSLSFLGLTSTSEVTWGTNLFWAQNGEALLSGAWWTFLPSGLAVAFVAFGLSLINYGLDEVTNPRLRAEKDLQNVVKNTGVRIRATPVAPRAH